MRVRLALLLLLTVLALPAAAAEAGGEGHGGDTLTTVFKWVNFFTVFGALGYFLRKPMRDFFASQRAAIQTAVSEGRQARRQAEQRLAEIERRLTRLGDEVESLRQEAAAQATAEQQRIREATRREAERMLATSQAEIESTSRAARLELRAYTARLAVTLAEQRIRQQLTPETHASLFAGFVAGLVAQGREGRP